MRADRLVAVLLLLQNRGTVTAAEVARHLEISERTARRDLDALAMAGLPVYSRQGRGGGWTLLGGARTDLTGLTVAEARALFLVLGPSSTATPEVRAALRKLVQALPETFREAAEAAAAATVVDPVGWGAPPARPDPPLLGVLQQAVVDQAEVTLAYVDRTGAATERTAAPLGVVAKGGRWYLVADTVAGRRTFRADRVQAVAATGQRIERPADFDLAAAWRAIADALDDQRAAVRAEALCEPSMLGLVRGICGARLVVGPAAPDGRVAVEIAGPTHDVVAKEIAGIADRLEVVGPPEVVRALAAHAARLVARYPVSDGG